MLSEKVKNWLVGPKALIVVAAIIGLVGWGGLGLIVGGVIGVVASLVFGVVVNQIQGGMIPREVRKELAEKVAIRNSDVVEAAYPELPKTEWVDALEDDAESIAARAVELAPSHEMVWAENNVLRAAREVAEQQETEAARALYKCMARQIAVDWYQKF